MGYQKVFKSEEGRGNHVRACNLAQKHCKEKLQLEKVSNDAIRTSCTSLTSFVVTASKKSRAREHQGSPFSENNDDLIFALDPSPEEALVDGRKINSGGSKRAPRTNEHKALVIEF